MKAIKESTFEQDFEKAYRYAKKTVHAFTPDPFLKDDLIQEFSRIVFSNKEKYSSLILYKRTIYLILEGVYNNIKRKKQPIYVGSRPEIIPQQTYIATYQNHTAHIDLSEKSEDYILSILYKCYQPNGRKGSVHSLEKQKELLNEFNRSNISTREFCEKNRISTATLHRLRTEGPKPVEVPKTIKYYVLFYIKGYSHKEIAEKFSVSEHSVSQALSSANAKINEFLMENDLHNQDLEQVYEIGI